MVASPGSSTISPASSWPGQVDVEGPVAQQCARVRPQVALFNTMHMVGQILPIVDELRRTAPGCAVVVLSDPGMRGTLPPRRPAPQLSFLVKGIQIPPSRPAGTKTVAVKPYRTSTGIASVTKSAYPSSNVSPPSRPPAPA
jgi:hypothetical protein